MTDTSCFGACCGCTCYGCTSCDYCKKGAACEYPDPDCCYCAPECYYVLIAGMTVNADRHCVDCCYETGGNPNLPCPNGDCCQSCGDPPNGCSRLDNCNGACGGWATGIDNTTCTFGNGTMILRNTYDYSCEWVATPKTETGQINRATSNCCDSSARPGCECLVNGTRPTDGLTCCCCDADMDPYCCVGHACDTDEDPCTACVPLGAPENGGLFNGITCNASVDECVEWWCGPKADYDPPGKSPCSDEAGSCNPPFTLAISASFYENSYTCEVGIVAYVTFGPDSWQFRNVWNFCCDPMYPIEWNVCLPYYCAIDCSVINIPIEYQSRRNWCDWFPGSLTLIGVPCPPIFFWEAKSLYFKKEGDETKYLNLSELRRRKWLKSIDKKMERVARQLAAEEVEFTPELVFNLVKRGEDNKLFKAEGDDDIHPIISKQYKRIQRIFFKQIKGKRTVRKDYEIKTIFENFCSNCPYSTGDSCMLNEETISPYPEALNFLMDGDAECPDFPPRWGPTSDPYTDVAQPKIL